MVDRSPGERYQGGPYALLFNPQGSKPLTQARVVGIAKVVYDSQCKSQIVILQKHMSGSRMIMPPSTGAFLQAKNTNFAPSQQHNVMQHNNVVNITHPVIVCQVLVPINGELNVDVAVLDTVGRYRLVFSTAFASVHAELHHCKLPLQNIVRGIWLEMVFHVHSIYAQVSPRKGAQIRGIEGLSLGPACCCVRRVYTLRDFRGGGGGVPTSAVSPATTPNTSAATLPPVIYLPSLFAFPTGVEKDILVYVSGEEGSVHVPPPAPPPQAKQPSAAVPPRRKSPSSAVPRAQHKASNRTLTESPEKVAIEKDVEPRTLTRPSRVAPRPNASSAPRVRVPIATGESHHPSVELDETAQLLARALRVTQKPPSTAPAVRALRGDTSDADHRDAPQHVVATVEQTAGLGTSQRHMTFGGGASSSMLSSSSTHRITVLSHSPVENPWLDDAGASSRPVEPQRANDPDERMTTPATGPECVRDVPHFADESDIAATTLSTSDSARGSDSFGDGDAVSDAEYADDGDENPQPQQQQEGELDDDDEPDDDDDYNVIILNSSRSAAVSGGATAPKKSTTAASHELSSEAVILTAVSPSKIRGTAIHEPSALRERPRGTSPAPPQHKDEEVRKTHLQSSAAETTFEVINVDSERNANDRHRDAAASSDVHHIRRSGGGGQFIDPCDVDSVVVDEAIDQHASVECDGWVIHRIAAWSAAAERVPRVGRYDHLLEVGLMDDSIKTAPGCGDDQRRTLAAVANSAHLGQGNKVVKTSAAAAASLATNSSSVVLADRELLVPPTPDDNTADIALRHRDEGRDIPLRVLQYPRDTRRPTLDDVAGVEPAATFHSTVGSRVVAPVMDGSPVHHDASCGRGSEHGTDEDDDILHDDHTTSGNSPPPYKEPSMDASQEGLPLPVRALTFDEKPARPYVVPRPVSSVGSVVSKALANTSSGTAGSTVCAIDRNRYRYDPMLDAYHDIVANTYLDAPPPAC